jgi:hypothetical protein
MYESSTTTERTDPRTERTEPRKEFQVKIVKVDRESVLRQADVF